MAGVDLHTHSTASDGTDSPENLVKLVAKAKITSFALTDHDTTSGLLEAERTAKQLDINFIPGCEVAVDYNGNEMHLLAYWIPVQSLTLASFLTKLRDFRQKRNQEIVEKLQTLGFKVSMEDVEAEASGNVGRPHMALALKSKGYVQSVQEAFALYLGKRGTAYVARELYSLEQGVATLVKEGATVVLAHPCLSLNADKASWNALLGRLRALGLSGIEGYHSSHTQEQVRLCADIAKENNLVLTGGSDYHGLVKPNIQLGIGSLNMRLQEYLLQDLQKKRLEQGLPL